MTITTIEVIDTAVKIGLGGLITIIGTIAIAKLNHKHDFNKERARRHFDALERVGEYVEEVTHIALRYWALIMEWARNNKQGLGLAENRKEELKKTKLELFDSFKNLTVAEAKLLLLGMNGTSILLRDYGDFLKSMRRKYYDGKMSLTESEMEKVREELLDKRQALFKSLSVSYKSDL